MPEGHTIHRYARLQRELLGGRRVAASSPQGRFAAGAAVLDGAVLSDIEAHGKHMFYRFADRDVSLHVHLGLFGRFRSFERDPQPPTPLTRLVLASDGVELQLSGPTICELIDPAADAALRDRLGPDPLHDDDPDAAFVALGRRTAPIGQVLLDQRVIAGIGNVYRAEVLFLFGIHPNRPAHALDRATFDDLWRLLRRLMIDGERRGRIITLQPADRTRPLSQLIDEQDRLYVYNRTGLPCRRCGTPIRSWELAGRTMFACPRCQSA
jgi:endonuclease VIII